MQRLPAETVQTLWHYHSQLQAPHVKMLVVHAPDKVKQDLLSQCSGPGLCFVPTLLDVAWGWPVQPCPAWPEGAISYGDSLTNYYV